MSMRELLEKTESAKRKPPKYFEAKIELWPPDDEASAEGETGEIDELRRQIEHAVDHHVFEMVRKYKGWSVSIGGFTGKG